MYSISLSVILERRLAKADEFIPLEVDEERRRLLRSILAQ
jgi:hypothetical protein